MLIIFDLDDTLIDSWSYSFPHKFKLIAEMLKQYVKSDTIFEDLTALNKTCANGNAVIKMYVEKFGLTSDVKEKALQILNETAEEPIIIPLIKGAEEIVHWAIKEHKLAIVTHGNEEEQKGKIACSKLDSELFSEILVSTTYDKTDSYRQVSNKLGFEYEDVLVIGDKYKTDLLPAKKLGMKTVHFKWGRGKIIVPESGEVDYIIEDLLELKDIVRALCKQ